MPTSWQITAPEGRRALIPLLTLATLGTVHQTGFGVMTWAWVIAVAGLLLAAACRSRPAGALLLLSGLLVALCAPMAARTRRGGGHA